MDMNTTEICSIIAEREKKGETLEEIYVHYHNAWVAEHEKPRDEQNIEKADEYIEIRNAVAILITTDALKEKGYIWTRGKKFSHWEKVNELEGD